MAYFKMDNKDNRLLIFNKYAGKCAYCGCGLTMNTLSIDHIIPLRRNMRNCVQGENTIDNCNPSCRGCNSSKSSMDLEKWRNDLSKKLLRLERDSCTYRLAKRFGMIKELSSSVKFYFEKI